MTVDINAIRCKNCHAPLILYGNCLRSKTLTCQHCGTVMDSQNEFQALYAFTHVQQLNSELRIGIHKTIRSIDFVVTGFITYQSHHASWTQFQLYSTTHGYAFIVEKDGKSVFLRKTYYLPDTNIWLKKQGDHFSIENTQFQIQRFYFAEIYYAAGDLAQQVQQGKRNKQCFSLSECSQQHYLSVQTRNQIEYYRGEIME